jgi:phospholipid N-methyltransferase
LRKTICSEHDAMGDITRFFRAMARDRRGVGAIAPSGRYLAHVMVRALGQVPAGGLVIELGPGTGVFTRPLLSKLPHTRLLAVEADRQLASLLRHRHPNATVITGCASALREHFQSIGARPDEVAGIVSGLPLLSLPGSLPRQILAAIADVLPIGGLYVQFTYSQLAWRRFETPGLEALASRRVLCNLPPATVLRFRRSDD